MRRSHRTIFTYRIPLKCLRSPLCTLGTTGPIWGEIVYLYRWNQLFGVLLVWNPTDTNIFLKPYVGVIFTVRVNPKRREIQQAQLERYFLGCVSEPLPLNSAQINVRAQARGRADTQPVTANGIKHARSADKRQITTNHIALIILQVSSLISNGVLNTNSHRQWRYTS